MFKNATFKLTVSYLTVVMVICLAFSAVVYHVGSNNLANSLTHESHELSNEFPIFSGTPYAAPNPGDLSAGRARLLDELILTNIFVLIFGGFICYFLARETMKPIEEAHEQQKRFTADVSHELRTPLTALKMESEVALLDDSLPKEALRAIIASNMEEATKLETLINSLMKLTRLDEGQLQQQFSDLNLKNLAKEAIDHVKPLADKKAAQLRLKGSSVIIKGDHNSLVQLIVIFLDNALKYSPNDAKVDIEISENKNGAKLEVRDFGSGIAPNDLEHVFDRFYRSSNHRSGSSGFGLGLSIAKMIADLHKAEIMISSQLHKGTTVSVNFPPANEKR